MFAEDLKKDFYWRIKGKRVLIVVNYDVDAICACKILQSLFQMDYVLYTLVPVDLFSDLKTSYQENHSDEKFVIFINCGGTVDIVEELEPAEDITFFILDSHRPIDVCNVYSTHQVVLLSKLNADDGIPNFNDIFKEDSEDEEEGSEEEGDCPEEGEDEENQQLKRRRLDEAAIIKRRERRNWEAKRDRLMLEYTQSGYYDSSSALIIYELAWQLSKDSFDTLWYGIVGLSEQMLMGKIDDKMYLSECGKVQTHIARLTLRNQELQDETSTNVKILFDKDIRLALYRHWTVESSLTYSVLPATRLKLWSLRGKKQLQCMLAEIGIPLTQCRQKFASMQLQFRKEFHESIVKMTDKYGLDDIVFVSFLLQHGFRAKYSATDVVYSLVALLQNTSGERPKEDCFLECLDALSRSKRARLEEGIELAKRMLVAVFQQVQSGLEMKQVLSAGPFLYLILQQECVDPILFAHPYGIFLLAEFVLKAYVASHKSKRAHALPLVVCAPLPGPGGGPGASETPETCHVVAIAPLAEESSKNFFGKAFEKAAEVSRSEIKATYFDSTVIQLSVKDRTKFFDALAVLLADDNPS